MRAPEFWSHDAFAARLAVAVLSPLGWVYGAATDWKRTHAAPYRPRAKVVCVGNLTVGGTGKTPIVIAIARQLTARKCRTLVLSRGYGGRLEGPVRVNPDIHDAADVGDEALLIAQSADVIVAQDRRRGAQLADRLGADVIVMDDGYQNFSLAKDLGLVVVDAQTGFGNGRLVPAGPLRETVRHGLARADGVVLVGAGRPSLPGFDGPVLRAYLHPRDAERLRGRKLIAFAGIGRPEKFFETLRALGNELVESFPFPDHHAFRPAEVAQLKAEARAAGAMLVTTEKDFVRLSPSERNDIAVLRIDARFDQPEALEHLLDRVLEQRAESV